jgi:hypothetical protein
VPIEGSQPGKATVIHEPLQNARFFQTLKAVDREQEVHFPADENSDHGGSW